MRAAGREFQCSSASRKFLNLPLVSDTARRTQFQCSSASRKFLNRRRSNQPCRRVQFQCSSASRKFLNMELLRSRAISRRSFSALQRAENFSMLMERDGDEAYYWVSVLFSEPKISQSFVATYTLFFSARFSALQRAENFSIAPGDASPGAGTGFQCSSASRKFLNPS